MKEYLVIGRSNSTTRTGSPYAMLKLTAEDETINVSVWEVPSDRGPVVGQLVSFLSMKDNLGKKSCNFPDMQLGEMPRPEHPLYGLLPRPVLREAWDSTIRTLIGYCRDERLIRLILEFADKLYAPYCKYPAATTVHHAYPGGLANHTFQMLHMLEGLYPCLPYPIRVERCILAILFHDYGKVYEYNPQGEPQEDMYLLGHIYIGAHKLHNELEACGIDKEEIKRIIHCVLAHHGELEYGSPVRPCTQEASIVSYLDNISAKTDGMDGTSGLEYCQAAGTRVVKG